MSVTAHEVKATAESLSPDDWTTVHLANFLPAFIFDPASPVQPLLASNGLLNDLGKAVSAWLVLTGTGFTDKATAKAEALLLELGIESPRIGDA